MPNRDSTNDRSAIRRLRFKRPLLVAIVGGSGSGKSWLADKLSKALGHRTGRLSLDDFYKDRSHLSPGRRAIINFDHPRSIDWKAFEAALISLVQGKSVRVPCYDYATHCRTRQTRLIRPKPILIVDGLWLLRNPVIRKLFDYRIFLDCPSKLRFQRRLMRDVRSRGRSESSIRMQFQSTVEPMHRRYVVPQSKFATVTLKGQSRDQDIAGIVAHLRKNRVNA